MIPRKWRLYAGATIGFILLSETVQTGVLIYLAVKGN